MKSPIVAILLFVASAATFSQQPVKINLLEYFDKVVHPPASAKEAYEKCGCNIPNRQGDCTTDTLFKSLTVKLEQFQQDISMPANSPQSDMMKKMQDPEYQKKIENMSQEEKMKMAMEMQAAYAPQTGPMKPESKAVIDAQREVSQLNEASAKDMQNINDNAHADMKYQQELEASHKAVDEWETAEIKKLPVIHTGGEAGDEIDPKAEFAVKVNAFKKHLAIVDEDLARTGKMWKETLEKRKQLYAPYEKAMEKIHFGDDAKNKETKTVLSSGQSLMIGSIMNLMQGSQTAFGGAIDWYDRYVQLEKNKPQR